MSATNLSSAFGNDFNRLRGHQLIKQVLISGTVCPSLLRVDSGSECKISEFGFLLLAFYIFSNPNSASEFCCQGILFDPETKELIRHNEAVIIDMSILKSLLLDCTIWSRDPNSWILQFQILNSLVDERHKYRLRTFYAFFLLLKYLKDFQLFRNFNFKEHFLGITI